MRAYYIATTTASGLTATNAAYSHRIPFEINQLDQYVPATGEPVIGIVIVKTAENYRVDIGSALTASLSHLAFEGATKRNKPNISVPIFTGSYNC